MKRRKQKKATNRKLTKEYLKDRADGLRKSGYPVSKWIEFAMDVLEMGLTARLYEARSTVSKYITITKGSRTFKVRFSNHKPNVYKELEGDCDFFVGHTHTGIRTTEDAINAVVEFFGIEVEELVEHG